MNLPVVVLLAVFGLIAVRQVGTVRMQIWQIMLAGAVVVVLGGALTPAQAAAAVDMDVMLFLFGMFVVGQGLEDSGYLAHRSYAYFKRARSRDTLVLMVLFGGLTGGRSSFLPRCSSSWRASGTRALSRASWRTFRGSLAARR